MTRSLRTLWRRPAPTRAPRLRLRDPAPQEVAQVQAAIGNWLLMWSAWRRAWTAFATFGTVPVIFDDPDPMRLLWRCRAAETAAASGRRV